LILLDAALRPASDKQEPEEDEPAETPAWPESKDG